MFATKPATPSLEFDELSRAFDRGSLAVLFDRDPDTVGRWRKDRRVPHTVEMVVDRFWWVMHVACTDRRWPVDAVRYFLLSIQPELGRRPAELVRESDEQARSVVQVIMEKPAPTIGSARGSATQESTMTADESPFAQLLAEEPDDDDVFTREYWTPSLVGRARPIGGVQEDFDPFRVQYTAKTSHAIPRRPSRAPFPNDFVAAVGRTIDWVWRKKRFADSSVSQHLYQWRVGIYGDDEDHVDFLIPYDEQAIDEATAKAFVDDFFGEVRKRLPTQAEKAREYEASQGSGAPIRDYKIGDAHARSAKKVSMRQMLNMPPFNLEHLTYESEAIAGAESHIEWEG